MTSARRRLGALIFACKQPSAYEAANVGFLRLVANQVAVAIENALAFQEIDPGGAAGGGSVSPPPGAGKDEVGQRRQVRRLAGGNGRPGWPA